MESYPEHLLVGVFPLVFAVNAISNAADDSTSAEQTHPSRTDFDRFLDAVAGSLADENDEADDMNDLLEFQPILPAETISSSRSVSLFRPDEYDLGDSTDDDLILDDTDMSVPSSISKPKRSASGANSLRLYAGFGLTRRSLTSGGVAHTHSTSNTSYAKALQQGQGFFQRTRIETIPADHQFPTSKDPEGADSIINALRQARSSPQKAKEIFTGRPIQGILPAQWLEKHVYSLPSVVIVVVKFTLSNQGYQDTRLLNAVKSLYRGLAPKRACKIHIVALVGDDVPAHQAQQWGSDISQQIMQSSSIMPNQQDSHQITLLRANKDLRSGADGFPTSLALKRLHRSVRDSSLMYYLDQTRRTKDKLSSLSDGLNRRGTGGARQTRSLPPKELLPLAIRYCFKIALFYEFQLRLENSIKFMAEGYRYARYYYHHLVRLSTRTADIGDEEEYLEETSKPISTSSISITMGETGEAEAVTTDASTQWSAGLPPPPSDMAHQCIFVADWLNFKLLQAGFGSHTEAGLLAADGQWRQHVRVFCTRRFLGGHPIMSEEWYFWSHVARQRLVTSQLVERHPPKALGDLGNEYDEVLLRCAPWRAYEAATEALLKVDFHLQKALAKQRVPSEDRKDETSLLYVGGLDKDGLAPFLEEHAKTNHKDKALELVLRAISLFEHEVGKEKQKGTIEDQECHRSWGRFGARLYYLAGGILVSTQRYSEAKIRLEKAAEYGKGWNGVDVSIRRLLADCYLNTPAPTIVPNAEESARWSSLALESCFFSKMAFDGLSKMLLSLQQRSDLTRDPSIQWHCESLSEFNDQIPLSFSVTFPHRSHATTGDTVLVSVWLRSNLDYPVALKSVSLMRLAGQKEITVPVTDFAKGPASFAVLLPRSTITFSTKITLPRSLDEISLEDVDGGTEKHSKNSSVKAARPRTAGITSAAGARLIPEGRFLLKPHISHAQWSLHFLGGKALRCEGIRLTLNPLEAAGKAPLVSKPIELTVEKVQRKAAAFLKRTPFEEDNYVASAWWRPLHMPLPSGPRCLRALGPVSDMRIVNVSESVSKGVAIEGTVNRVCLKLEAGRDERCSEIKYKIKVTTAFEASDGTTKRLTEVESPEENMFCMKGPDVRAPVLVAKSQLVRAGLVSDYGFDLPDGWELCGSGQEMNGEIAKPSSLAPGGSTYMFIQLYRAPDLDSGRVADAVEQTSQSHSVFQTDFEVFVSYRQEKTRKQSIGPGLEIEEGRVSNDVSQTFTGSVTWTKPIVSTQDIPPKSDMPCGSGHHSNLADMTKPVDSSYILSNVPLIDGERVSIRNVLKANTSVEDFAFEIVTIRREKEDGQESAESGDPVLLYQAEKNEATRWLKQQSKFCLISSVQAHLVDRAQRSLGAVSVDWLPIKIDLPEEAKDALGPDDCQHGPLVLASPTSAKFRGPMSFIEKAPFKVTFHCVPCIPHVSVPFDVHYSVTNDTSYHQRLSVVLDSQQQQGIKPKILTCGFVCRDLRLAPHETKLVSYTAIATRPGTMALPNAYIASIRYNAWVVNEGLPNQRQLCILP